MIDKWDIIGLLVMAVPVVLFAAASGLRKYRDRR